MPFTGRAQGDGARKIKPLSPEFLSSRGGENACPQVDVTRSDEPQQCWQ